MKWLALLSLTAVLLSAGLGEIKAQDPVFSQFYNAPIQLNPALAGLSEQSQISINYRNQWPAWPQVYATYAASYDQFIAPLNSGLGIQVLSDDAGQGILKTNKITGAYSYRLVINRDYQARIGVEVGMIQTQLDWDKLFFGDQLAFGADGTPGGTILPPTEIRPDQLSNITMDISIGAVVYGSKYYGGIALKHVNGPDTRFRSETNSSITGLPSRLTIHGGAQIDLDGYNKRGFGSFIAPSILFTRQSGLSQLNAGALYNRENVFGGLWIRHDLSNIDAAIFSFGVRNDWIKASYSFDLTLSDAVITRTAGSHEIGIVMRLGGWEKRRSRYEDCFSIFR